MVKKTNYQGRSNSSRCKYIIELEFVLVISSKHAGATANQLNHYQEYFLKNNKPDRIIISAGMNDILHSHSNNINLEEIADKVINIGKTSNKEGVKDVFILGLYKVKDIPSHVIDNFNQILEIKCVSYNFGFVCNSNIKLCDLFDGLYVNTISNNKLRNNILLFFDTCRGRLRNN